MVIRAGMDEEAAEVKRKQIQERASEVEGLAFGAGKRFQHRQRGFLARAFHTVCHRGYRVHIAHLAFRIHIAAGRGVLFDNPRVPVILAFRRHIPGADLRQALPGAVVPSAVHPPADAVRLVPQISPAQVHSIFQTGGCQPPVQAFHPSHIRCSFFICLCPVSGNHPVCRFCVEGHDNPKTG